MSKAIKFTGSQIPGINAFSAFTPDALKIDIPDNFESLSETGECTLFILIRLLLPTDIVFETIYRRNMNETYTEKKR